MRYGTIVTFFADKNFGFIKSDTGKDIFFHISVVESSETPPEIKVGQHVKYDLAPRGEARPSDRSDSKPRPDNSNAKVVVLLDKAPGGVAPDEDTQKKSRHPRARKKKPTWRR